jgi:hypothetical protein
MPVEICADWSDGAAADAALTIAPNTRATRTIFNRAERENIGNLLPNREEWLDRAEIPAPCQL